MPKPDIEGDDRHRTPTGAIGRGEMQGIQRARARSDTEVGSPTTHRVIERDDEGAFPITFEGQRRHAKLGVTKVTVERQHDLHKSVTTGHPLGVSQQRGLRNIAAFLRDIPLDERAAVDVQGQDSRSRAINSVVLGVPGNGLWRTIASGARSA